MAKLTRTVIVKAPVEQVFKALDDPNALPFLYNCVCNLSDFQSSQKRLGDTFKGTFSVIGLQFDVTFTCTERDPPLKIVERFEGAMNGTMVFILETRSNSTSVSLQVDYEISKGLLGKIANKLLFERMNEKSAERMLENLTIEVEALGARQEERAAGRLAAGG